MSGYYNYASSGGKGDNYNLIKVERHNDTATGTEDLSEPTIGNAASDWYNNQRSKDGEIVFKEYTVTDIYNNKIRYTK